MKRFLLMICLALMVSSCAREAPAAWDGPILGQSRDQLTVEQLQEDKFSPLVDMSYFAKPEWAAEAAYPFSGSVSFAEQGLYFPKDRASYPGENTFPAFDIDFFAHEGELIPYVSS